MQHCCVGAVWSSPESRVVRLAGTPNKAGNYYKAVAEVTKKNVATQEEISRVCRVWKYNRGKLSVFFTNQHSLPTKTLQ